MNDKNKIRNLLFYIGIPILIILVLTIVYGSQPRQTKTTYELVEYFQKGEVADYEINYGTGAITLTLNDKEKTEVKGELADITEFLDTVEPYVDDAKEPVTYNYIKATDNSFLFDLIPTLIMVGVLVVLWIVIMKKMGGGGLGGKEMNFGKAKIKDTNDSVTPIPFKI